MPELRHKLAPPCCNALQMDPLPRTRNMTWVLLLLALFSVLIYMGGLASLRYGCNAGCASPTLQKSSGAAITAFGMSSSFANCGTVSRFHWFVFAFVTFTLFCIFLATFSRWGLHYARPFVSNLVAICVVLMMIASEAFTGYEMVYDSVDLGEYTWWHARFRSACAGAIMTVVWLILLLMAVGTDWERNTGERVRDPKITPIYEVPPPTAGTAAVGIV